MKKDNLLGNKYFSNSDHRKVTNGEEANKAYTGFYHLSGFMCVLYQLYLFRISFSKETEIFVFNFLYSTEKYTKQ